MKKTSKSHVVCYLSNYQIEFSPIFFLLFFRCTWCTNVHRCSDGADRLREHWDKNECSWHNVSTTDQCENLDYTEHTEWRSSMVGEDLNLEDSDTSSTSTVISAVVSSLMVLILLILAATFIGEKIKFTIFIRKFENVF